MAAGSSIADYLDELQGSNASDRIAIDAIKYNLVAIGEAANHISEELRRAHQEVDWPAIVGLRNLLAHRYFRVDPERILDIAETNVPDLLVRCEGLLTEV